MQSPKLRKVFLGAGVAAVLVIVGGLLLGNYYGLSAVETGKQMLRIGVASAGKAVYLSDAADAERAVSAYHVGAVETDAGAPDQSWVSVGRSVPGLTAAGSAAQPIRHDIPFVYQDAGAGYLEKFRQHFRLDEVIAGAADEYDAMLKLGGWMGTRWDHGTDVLPDDSQVCDPIRVVERGRQGAKYWCEIAARTMVHAASSVGWPARLISGSSDGYTWEHAVAELWSNQFNKWFVIDADFNVAYEHDGIPLSAFELSHHGLQWQQQGTLTTRLIAPAKASLPLADVLPLYRYVHIDMRNDWCSRSLPRGSPAGGDAATWWTARPGMRVLTARRRVDDPALFDWKVNAVSIAARHASVAGAGRVSLDLALSGYSPVFDRFELSVDDGPWHEVQDARATLTLDAGTHALSARIVTRAGVKGPAYRLQLAVPSPAAG